MISVEEAKTLLGSFNPEHKYVKSELACSEGFVLSDNVYSTINMPPFAQSAMDGYALGNGDLSPKTKYKVVDEIAAGTNIKKVLKPGECMRIFTGAPVPENCIAVVQQEWIETEKGNVILKRGVALGMHIRSPGEQVKMEELAVEKGTLITPATIGFLAMLGVRTVMVYSKPNVEIIVTGNELAAPGQSLKYGQIYESNSQMLRTALAKEGMVGKSSAVKDNLNDTKEKIEHALEFNDIVVLTGGISVGDHDYVGTALKQLGVKEVFYKVAQKPGKPIFFGTRGNKAVFALPGNPAASLTCFYEYVIPILRMSYGRKDLFLTTLRLPLAIGYTIRSLPRAQFLKAQINNGKVRILEGQSSAMLNTFALSNAQVYVRANTPIVKECELVEVHLLPQ